MIVLDLKTVLFGLLLFVLVLIYLAVVAARRRQDVRRQILNGDTAELQRILDTAPFGLLLLDQSPAIVYANSYAQRLLPAPAAEASQHPAADQWTGELLRDVSALTSAREATQANGSHYRVLNLPSEQTVSWWIYPLQGWTLVVLMDLSQQRQMERSLHLFLSNLSHELRTPLTAILAHTEVLRTPDLPDTVQQNSVSLIHREANRIARLVQNLLELSRLETTADLDQRPVDLHLVAEEAIADIILEAESRHISISLQADNALARVPADADKLKQVLLNLLDNAVKYCRPHDRVEVSLEKRPHGIRVTVRDTGPGIPPQHLPRVTQRLYRGRTDVEGSGLGLALADEILRRHHSQLQIESENEGEATGTAVRFTLPTV